MEKREDHEAQLKQHIYDLWMRCEPQNKIAEVVDISPQRVNEIIAEKSGFGQVAETGFFRDFEQENSALRIYDLWLRCETHEKIAEITGYDRTTITKIIQNKKRKEGK
ncbi:MAG TPA: hypothetical protein VKL21_01500 [Candidatus Methanoperedens sp.]|nr:hypothetical protein [Candidatus Methanoperedens sp.]